MISFVGDFASTSNKLWVMQQNTENRVSVWGKLQMQIRQYYPRADNTNTLDMRLTRR